MIIVKLTSGSFRFKDPILNEKNPKQHAQNDFINNKGRLTGNFLQRCVNFGAL